ncbi:hypothetical protein HanRHA438_Chr16g0780021 [Helianthus annuus]|nr:hypothetical protein HanRHA438_Chr16g0780021 [Helianthus annuus]
MERDEEKHMRTLVKEDFGQPDRVNTMPCIQPPFKIYLQWRKDDNINLQAGLIVLALALESAPWRKATLGTTTIAFVQVR